MDKSERKIRVLVAKPGTDSHYRGAEVLCQILRNAGMEVIYTGRYQTSDMIVNAAIAEESIRVRAGRFLKEAREVLPV